MGGGPKSRMSCGQEVWYKYRSVDTCIVMSWLINQGDLWEMVSKLINETWDDGLINIWAQRCERCLEQVLGDFGLAANGATPDVW